jgi:hypothetical protein
VEFLPGSFNLVVLPVNNEVKQSQAESFTANWEVPTESAYR